LKRIWLLRKSLAALPSAEAMELMLGKLQKTTSNAEFLMGIKTKTTD